MRYTWLITAKIVTIAFLATGIIMSIMGYLAIHDSPADKALLEMYYTALSTGDPVLRSMAWTMTVAHDNIMYWMMLLVGNMMILAAYNTIVYLETLKLKQKINEVAEKL